MGTRERKHREFVDREQLFLQAAREQICADGLLSLQMAKVARACDYATGTLYQHFASKEDLLVAISAEMSETRVNFFERVANWDAPSRDRMFAIAVGDTLYLKRVKAAEIGDLIECKRSIVDKPHGRGFRHEGQRHLTS